MRHSSSLLKENLLFEGQKHEELDEISHNLSVPDSEKLNFYGYYDTTLEIPFKSDLYTPTATYAQFRYNPYGSDSVSHSRSLCNIPESCPICSMEIESNEIFRIPECNHIFCTSCIRQYLETRVNESQVLTMPCPEYSCVNMIPEHLINRVLTDEILQKYQRFKKEAELTNRVNLRWCAIPDCEGYDFGGTRKKKLTCNVCSNKYCYYCGENWKNKHPKCNATNDLKLDAWSKKHEVKHCPNCKRRVEKVEGCNHMTCSKCRYEWCWLCGAKYHPGHISECEVLKITNRNVAWTKVGLILLGPLIGLFICVIVTIWFILEVYSENLSRRGCKKFIDLFLLFMIAIPLSTAITPLAFIVMIVISGPFSIHQMIRGNMFRLYERSDLCLWFMKYIIGTCISPIVSALTIVAVAISPVLGLALVFYKLYMFLRRRCDPDYINLRGYGDY